ncbi:MAG: PilZ domain-containing protein [Rhodospirillaceae bacterium]|jgi:hypothetical protein|nr:PilZ domain-containing protein [Rhodospirillaceae bacterium]MBT5194505.1 PilZ domain-containing protein [Rhodospirillaceae bacterium]MBT5897581.1 PilZ domain-containing protein [Rhodospirillaceae bacterium]MBT7757515.1 PilZ domain-containing protein [Rhodospirillaceae bacterium]
MRERTEGPISGAASPVATDEQRRYQRYQTDEVAVIRFAGIETTGVMSDLSLGGTMIEGDFAVAIEAGTQMTLSFGEFSQLPAVVVYVGDSFCGVQFLDAAKHREAIKSWMQQHKLARAMR